MSEHGDHDVAAEQLQGGLRDLLCLAVVGDHVCWVAAGEQAAEFGAWLVDAAAQWRAWADEMAKQLVALGVAPGGRVRSLAKDIPLNWVPDGWLPVVEARRLLADRLGTVAGSAGYRRSQVTDPDIVRLFDAVCSGLETQRRAQAG